MELFNDSRHPFANPCFNEAFSCLYNICFSRCAYDSQTKLNPESAKMWLIFVINSPLQWSSRAILYNTFEYLLDIAMVSSHQNLINLVLIRTEIG